MKICFKCFKHPELISMIESLGQVGNCDFNQDHKNEFYCDLDISVEEPKSTTAENKENSMRNRQTVEDLKNILRQIIDIYVPSSELPPDFPHDKQDLLRHSLEKRWSLFNLEAEEIQKILVHLFNGDNDFNKLLLSQTVGVLEEMPDYRFENDPYVIKNNEWSHFATSLKYVNRFHTDSLNLENFKYFLTFTEKTIPKESSKYFRARINNSDNIPLDKMAAPPIGTASAGRLNPQWITVLYLSDDRVATIQEVRATFNDTVYIAEFELARNIKVVDLRNLEDITMSGSVDNLKYYLNRPFLVELRKEFVKAVNNDIKETEYLPLQYISEFIKSLRLDDSEDSLFDGILYQSVANKEASNLVLFDEKLAIARRVDRRVVREINYRLD